MFKSRNAKKQKLTDEGLSYWNAIHCQTFQLQTTETKNHLIKFRTTATGSLKTGDILRTEGNKFSIVVGTRVRNPEHLAVCDIINPYSLTPSEVERLPTKYVRTPKSFDYTLEQLPFTNFDLPDMFLTPDRQPTDEKETWKIPCHRVILARYSERLDALVRALAPGTELSLPVDEFSKLTLEHLLDIMYNGTKLDHEKVTVKLLAEWGFWSILQYHEDFEVTTDNYLDMSTVVHNNERMNLLPLCNKLNDYILSTHSDV